MSRETTLAQLRALHDEWDPPVSDFCGRVRHLVLIVCSSRGGSSVFTEMLRHHPGMIHLPGEINPYLAMAGLSHPESGTGSDALDRTHATDAATAVLSRAFAHHAGQPTTVIDRGRLARDLTWRLTAQWPGQVFTLSRIADCVDAALEEMDLTHPQRLQRGHALLLRAVREIYPVVNPWYADLSPDLIHELFPKVSEPTGPASPDVIEEAPFVLTQPWSPVTEADLATRPFVFKTPSNAYRLPFLRALFPNARLQVLHLTRNPAAAINGLVDGWRFRGFHAHRMTQPLTIEGYAEGDSADAHWWKYDLPPGWRDWTNKSLVEVAGFQWSTAHQSVLDHLRDEPAETFRLRFEDVVGPTDIREQRMSELLEWMGVAPSPALTRIIHEGLPPIMATARPRQRRWFARATLIDPVLQRPNVAATAQALGYTDRSAWT